MSYKHYYKYKYYLVIIITVFFIHSPQALPSASIYSLKKQFGPFINQQTNGKFINAIK